MQHSGDEQLEPVAGTPTQSRDVAAIIISLVAAAVVAAAVVGLAVWRKAHTNTPAIALEHEHGPASINESGNSSLSASSQFDSTVASIEFDFEEILGPPSDVLDLTFEEDDDVNDSTWNDLQGAVDSYATSRGGAVHVGTRDDGQGWADIEHVLRTTPVKDAVEKSPRYKKHQHQYQQHDARDGEYGEWDDALAAHASPSLELGSPQEAKHIPGVDAHDWDDTTHALAAHAVQPQGAAGTGVQPHVSNSQASDDWGDTTHALAAHARQSPAEPTEPTYPTAAVNNQGQEAQGWDDTATALTSQASSSSVLEGVGFGDLAHGDDNLTGFGDVANVLTAHAISTNTAASDLEYEI